MKNKGFFWLCHHDVLVEYCYDYKRRVAFIEANKPEKEILIRLRWFLPVKGELPKEFVGAGQEYRAWQRCVEAKSEHDAVWCKYKKELEALHKKECPGCPWNGETLFPVKEKEK